MKHLPIGFFDSGIGGLTVMREAASLLPHENLIYLGDTARLPYGTKSPDTIRRFSLENARFLRDQNIKLLVIACHTACSHALEIVKNDLSVPVVGVLEAACSALIAAANLKKVGILGTQGTIASGVIEKTLRIIRPDIEIFPVACPLFVSLVEERFHNHPAADLVAERYLAPLREQKIDAALLACTHYPLLRSCIQKALPDVELFEPASGCARQIQSTLEKTGAFNTSQTLPSYQFFATDDPIKFQANANLFFPTPIKQVFQVAVNRLL